MLKPKSILEQAKTELGNIIITYLRKLAGYLATDDKRLMASPEESIYLTSDELEGDMPVVEVETDNSYLDVEDRTYKYLPIDRICLCDGEFYVEIGDAELYENDLTAEEMESIAQFLIDEWVKIQQ